MDEAVHSTETFRNRSHYSIYSFDLRRVYIELILIVIVKLRARMMLT
jgi:hypothetical protein